MSNIQLRNHPKQIRAALPAENPQCNVLNSPPQSAEWQVYRTRFTIRARILTAPLNFIDALGREQEGNRGDYLVESNGVVTITHRRIFEDIYVPLDPSPMPAKVAGSGSGHPVPADLFRKAPLSTKKGGFFSSARRKSYS